jgi:SAM-dependent methyltransferase
MTALQIAYAHCSNWRKDDKGCLGAIIDDDLQVRRCYPRAKCVLREPGKRCPYFEECVAPMASSIENARVRAEFEAAVRDYNVLYFVRDVFADGFGGEVGSKDACLLFNILHCEAPLRLLAETARVVRPGGQCVAAAHSQGQGVRGSHDRSNSPVSERLIALFVPEISSKESDASNASPVPREGRSCKRPPLLDLCGSPSSGGGGPA